MFLNFNLAQKQLQQKYKKKELRYFNCNQFRGQFL